MTLTTVRKTKTAQKQGAYQPTAIDAQKAAADFRLVSVGKKNTIVWAGGVVERVTDARLVALQAALSYAVDF